MVHAVSAVDGAEDEPWKTRLQKRKSVDESAALAEVSEICRVRGRLLMETFFLLFSLVVLGCFFSPSFCYCLIMCAW